MRSPQDGEEREVRIRRLSEQEHLAEKQRQAGLDGLMLLGMVIAVAIIVVLIWPAINPKTCSDQDGRTYPALKGGGCAPGEVSN